MSKGHRFAALMPAAAPLVALLAVCGPVRAQDNILLIVVDDVGVDMIGAYAEHPDPARTPVVDSLAAQGVLFRNAWSHPTCSPTRASILTGRSPRRTGIGRALAPGFDPVELSIHELALPKALPEAYTSVALGKWHLSSLEPQGHWLQHPLLLGFAEHRGSPWNLPDAAGQQAYFLWDKSINGKIVRSEIYATTDTVDDALAVIASTPEPWFVYLAFNAAHTPEHKPPPELHTYDLSEVIADDLVTHTKAMIEAVDTELGRLLAGVEPGVLARTTILFMGDNGTHPDATTAPFVPGHSKATPYEGGVNVPLIVKARGAAAGAECTALVAAVDVFGSVLDLAGAPLPPGAESVSFVPYLTDPQLPSLRDWVFAESFKPNGFGPFLLHFRTARDARFKLIDRQAVFPGGTGEEFYDLAEDPWEQQNLLTAEPLPDEAAAAYATLRAVIDAQVGPWENLGHALAGSHGAPSMRGSGTLLPGDTLKLTVESSASAAAATLVLGLSALQAPFKGGVLVPDPASLPGAMLALTTGAGGKLLLESTWPVGIPLGTELYLQLWIADPAAPRGYSATNALLARAQ